MQEDLSRSEEPTQSSWGYLQVYAPGEVTHLANKKDVEVATVGNNIWMFSVAKRSARDEKLSNTSRDAIGVKKLEVDGQVIWLLVQADGMGSSNFAKDSGGKYVYLDSVDLKKQYRSILVELVQKVVKQTVESGKTDFYQNLDQAIKTAATLYSTDEDFKAASIQQQIEFDLVNENGVETTFGQLTINQATGEVDGLFAADGSVLVVRTTGEVENIQMNKLNLIIPSAYISTKAGYLEDINTLQNATNSRGLILNSGDIAFFITDGFDSLEGTEKPQSLVDTSSWKELKQAVLETYEQGTTTDKIADLIAHIASTDDFSMITYRQP